MKLIRIYVGLVFIFILSLLASAVVISCGPKEATTPSMEKLAIQSYAQLNSSVLVPYCLQCHTGGKRDLSTYASVMQYVKAGEPDQSKLCVLVRSGAMPPSKSLGSEVIDGICSWISLGALE